MYHKKKSIFAMVVALLATVSLTETGCASHEMTQASGVYLEASKIAMIEKGKTTRAEIETMFGKPDGSFMLHDGRRSISYSYSEVKGNGTAKFTPLMLIGMPPDVKVNGQTHTQTLQVYLTKESIVEDFEFNDNESQIERDGKGNSITIKK